MKTQAILDTYHRLIGEGREGFVVGLNGEEFVPPEGFAVGMRRFDTPEAAIEHMRPDVFLGWWRSPAGETFIDLIQIYEGRGTAMLAAFTRGELAIYDFGNDELIDLTRFYTPKPADEPEVGSD